MKMSVLFLVFFMVIVLLSSSAAAYTDGYDIKMFRGVFSEIIKDPTIAGMMGNERINIFVDDEIKGHIITKNSEIVETGEDKLEDATLNVYVESETIQYLTEGKTTFLNAFKSGKIRLGGVGFFNTIRFAIAQFLFNLYSLFGGVPDSDGDGLDDRMDGCPNEAGPRANDGCPLTDCDDGDPCTIDSQDSSTGTCTHVPKDCSDGDPETDDYCEPSTGNCSHVPQAEKCTLADVSIEGAVINELSRNMKLFVDYKGDFDQRFVAYLEYLGTTYAWFFDAKAETVTEVTIPEDIVLVSGAGPNPIKDVSKVIVISTQCRFNDSVDSSWITKKSQFCRYAEASIDGAMYDDTSDELVLSVNNSGDVDLNFLVYLQYAGDPLTYAWHFDAKANQAKDVTMSEMFRDFKPLEMIGSEVSWVTVTGVECQIGEYRFDGPDIA